MESLAPRKTGSLLVYLAVFVTAAVIPPGCSGSGKTTRLEYRHLWNEDSFNSLKPPPPPEWRTVDRNGLAAGLGWWDVTKGNASKNLVALTFDAGSGGGHTPTILDALKAAGLHCTFFITGDFAQTYPAVVKRIALEGHELGNHSFSHPRFQNLTLDQARSQLSRTEAKVVELTGLTTRPYFRFPYGWRSNALIKMVNEEGYLSVSWTFDSLDSDPRTSCETIRSRVSKYACPGAIVLMHCGSPQEAQVIPTVIEDLKAAGYEIVTVTEVLSP